MTQISPKRIVLRFQEKYGHESGTIIEKLFGALNINPEQDYFPELFPPDDSTKMHLVIDLYCKSFPSINLDRISYEVYRVKKASDFAYEKLAFNAPNEARSRCATLTWGATDRA